MGRARATTHIVLDQDRLNAIGLSSADAAQQLHFLLTGTPITQVREDIRAADAVARSAGNDRLAARLHPGGQRGAARAARPVILTAMATVRAFVPPTHSVFWGSMAYTLIGGTIGGKARTLVFLPALYAIWFRVKPTHDGDPGASYGQPSPSLN